MFLNIRFPYRLYLLALSIYKCSTQANMDQKKFTPEKTTMYKMLDVKITVDTSNVLINYCHS